METKRNRQRGFATGLVVTLLILGALFVGGIALYGYAASTRTEAVSREIALSAQYQSNQNYLSSYISTFYEQVGIAGAKSDKMNQILVDAVKGRYDKEGLKNGSLFSMMKEAYPNLGGLDIYDKILPTIAAGREGYRNIQDKLLDQLRSYDTWREQGLLRPIVLGNFFPSNHLEARLGETTYTGQEARRKMYLIVLAGDAVKAYQTGTMDPLAIPKK